jgi:hypothetical protein
MNDVPANKSVGGMGVSLTTSRAASSSAAAMSGPSTI